MRLFNAHVVSASLIALPLVHAAAQTPQPPAPAAPAPAAPAAPAAQPAAAAPADADPLAALPADVRALIGDWTPIEGKEPPIRFEPSRMITVGTGGELQFGRVTYEPGVINVRYMGVPVRYTFSIADGILNLTPPSGNGTSFRKLAKPSETLDLTPLTLGKPAPVAADRVEKIQGELAERSRRDQELRNGDGADAAIAKLDAENTAYLLALVQEIGWIDPERFGQEAAINAFVLVQHTPNLRLMLAALTQIEKDVKADALDGQLYALLFDRTRVLTGQKQRYGTQLGQGANGGIVVLALEDPAKVEALREKLGMESLKDYVDSINEQNAGLDVKLEDDPKGVK